VADGVEALLDPEGVERGERQREQQDDAVIGIGGGVSQGLKPCCSAPFRHDSSRALIHNGRRNTLYEQQVGPQQDFFDWDCGLIA